MPFIPCWTPVAIICSACGESGKHKPDCKEVSQPCQRQCGAIVSCGFLQLSATDSRVWKGTCEKCHTIYRCIVASTMLPQTDDLASLLHEALPYVANWMTANEDGWIEKKAALKARIEKALTGFSQASTTKVTL